MNRILLSPLCLVGILVGTSIQSVSQIFPFRPYTTKDGLPSNDIHALYQDVRGFLWIGTAEGLSIYDGNTFRNYNSNDGLAFDFVNDIIEDPTSPGTLWIATYGGGVSKFSDGKFTTYHLGSRQVSDFVTTLMLDHRGDLWCGSDSGVILLKNNIITDFHREAGFQAVKSIVELNDSTVWISSNSGLFCYSRSSGKLDIVDIQEPEQQAEKMCKDGLGDLWVGTYGGDILQIRENKILRRLRCGLHRTSGYDTFNSLNDDGKGNLWASTKSGLIKIPKDQASSSRVIKYTVANGLPENQTYAFLIDRDENFWVGSLTQGLAKLTGQNLYKFSFPGFTFYTINNSGGIADRWGHIWLIASKGLWEIWREAQGQWHTFFHRLLNERSPSMLASIVCDSQDQLWVSMFPPMIRCYTAQRRQDQKSRVDVNKELLLHQSDVPTIICFLIDKRGNIWISTKIGVVVEFSPSGEKIHTFTAVDGIPTTSIRALFEDHDGNIWIGGGYGGGIAMVPKGDWKQSITERYTLKNGLSNDFIRALGEDKNGRLLIGSRFGGLSILDHGRFITYTTKNGLYSNGIWGITRDSSGNIILGTHLGLQVFHEGMPKLFESNHELVGGPVWSSGVYRNRDAWLVQQDALIIYEYSRREHVSLPPPVYITNLTVNGDQVQLDHSAEFTHDRNNIVVSFIGISYKDEHANRYRYRLLAADQEWQPVTSQTSVAYAALKPGSYTFEVKVINSEGIESLHPAAISFVILSPFWMRWWFIVLANIFVLGMVTIAYRYRMYQLLKIERMRTRIASDLHDDIGASLTRIALFSEVAKEEAEKSSPRLVEMAEKIGVNARELLDAVGTLVWSIDPRHDRFEDVVTHMKNFAQEMLSIKGIEYNFAVQKEAIQRQLPLDARKNILLIFKEAVNNITKHAACHHVDISMNIRNGIFEVRITDDGKGLSSTILRPGHGLMNMQTRAQSIKGHLDIQSEKGRGVTICLKIPVSN